jgi:hypothetical protein
VAEILLAGVEPGEEAALLEFRHHVTHQQANLLLGELAVIVFVDRRNLILAGMGVELHSISTCV